MKISISLLGGAAVSFLPAVQAHTWLEDLRVISSKGTFVGELGYMRGFLPRNSPARTSDSDVIYQLAGNIPLDAPICRFNKQTQGFPVLQAAPGDRIALRYAENGHVTINGPNDGRPFRNGLVYVYGTKEPKATDTYFGIHKVWNTAGTGGDKRGKLLATRYYDDGQCYQAQGANQTPLNKERSVKFPGTGDLLCQTDIQLPADAGTSGAYSLYWVWDWPLLSPDGGKLNNETYTSCSDIKMTEKSAAGTGVKAIATDPEFKFNEVAISEQLKNEFLFDPSATPALTAAPAASNLPTGDSSAAPTATAPATSSESSSARSPSSSSTLTPLPLDSFKPGPTSASSANTGISKKPTISPTDTPQGFKTITVTAPAKEKLVTVTETKYITESPAASSKPSSGFSTRSSSSKNGTGVVTKTVTASTTLASSKEASSTNVYTSVPEFDPTITVTPSAEPTASPTEVSSTSQSVEPTGDVQTPVVRPFLPPAESQIESSSGSATASASGLTTSTSATKASSSAPSSSKSACTKIATGGQSGETGVASNGTIPEYTRHKHRRHIRVKL